MSKNISDYTIRPAVPEDAERLLEIYAPYVMETSITYEYDVPSLEDFKSRIEGTLAKYPYIVACDASGKIVGYAYAGVFHARKAYECSAELSIYVDRSLHARGIGRLLYTQLEQLLKERNIITLYACIAATSREQDPYLTDASIKFHSRMGYTLVGRFTRCARKFDMWYDMVYMEKHL